jgi:hypothetical protein
MSATLLFWHAWMLPPFGSVLTPLTLVNSLYNSVITACGNIVVMLTFLFRTLQVPENNITSSPVSTLEEIRTHMTQLWLSSTFPQLDLTFHIVKPHVEYSQLVQRESSIEAYVYRSGICFRTLQTFPNQILLKDFTLSFTFILSYSSKSVSFPCSSWLSLSLFIVHLLFSWKVRKFNTLSHILFILYVILVLWKPLLNVVWNIPVYTNISLSVRGLFHDNVPLKKIIYTTCV